LSPPIGLGAQKHESQLSRESLQIARKTFRKRHDMAIIDNLKKSPTPLGNRLPLTRMHFVQIVGAVSIMAHLFLGNCLGHIFRRFDASGKATEVKAVKSTGYDSLDEADPEKPTGPGVHYGVAIKFNPSDAPGF
jgi:hypothetical protein